MQKLFSEIWHNLSQITMGFMLILCLCFILVTMSELRSRDMLIVSIETELVKFEKAGLKDKANELENILKTAKRMKVFGTLSDADDSYAILRRFALAMGEKVEENKIRTFFSRIGSYCSYDFLLSLSMIMASYAGASCFSFYKKQQLNVREESLGAAVGLMLYLSFKGGAFVFLIHNNNITNDSNIYTSLLIALIAGLFSEKLLNYLEKMVTDAAASKPESLDDKQAKAVRTDKPAMPAQQVPDVVGAEVIGDRPQIL